MSKLSEYLLESIREFNSDAADVVSNYQNSDEMLVEAFATTVSPNSIDASKGAESTMAKLVDKTKQSIEKISKTLGIRLKSLNLAKKPKPGQSNASWIISNVFSVIKSLIDIFKYLLKKIIEVVTNPKLKSFGISAVSLLLTVSMLPFSALGITPSSVLSRKVPKLTALTSLDQKSMMRVVADLFTTMGKNIVGSFRNLKSEMETQAGGSDWLVYGAIAFAAVSGWLVYALPFFTSLAILTRNALKFDIEDFIKKVELTIAQGRKNIDLYLEIFSNSSSVVLDLIEVSGRRELVGIGIMLDDLKRAYRSAIASEELHAANNV